MSKVSKRTRRIREMEMTKARLGKGFKNKVDNASEKAGEEYLKAI